MKLTSLNCQIPTQKISNNEVLDMIEFYSKPYFKRNFSELKQQINQYFEKTGIETRFWRNKQTSMELIEEAVANALTTANITPEEIDLLIYCSVDRGFLEPANASFICKSLHLKNIRSFDVVDACMGWYTAVQVAESFLNNYDEINNVIIISSECPMSNSGSVLPNNFTIKSIEELQWKAPSFTLGEAVTASIFTNSKEDIRFEYIEQPQFADLCTIPLPNYKNYSESSSKKMECLQFSSYGSDLSTKGIRYAIEVLEIFLKKLNYSPSIIFPHSVSNRVINFAKGRISTKVLIYSTFSELGNIATSSIPASIHKAMLNNKIKEGQKGVGWVASAGMKFSAFEINL